MRNLDAVNGCIIGGDHITAALHKYDGDKSQQGPTFYAESELDAKSQAELWYKANKYAGPVDLYPSGLELRIY
jgi:hypothetical protein